MPNALITVVRFRSRPNAADTKSQTSMKHYETNRDEKALCTRLQTSA